MGDKTLCHMGDGQEKGNHVIQRDASQSKKATTGFESLARQAFRDWFQPSRIVLGVFADERLGRPNIITLCFDMHCSYKPPMMAFAISTESYTYRLLEHSKECVLAVPGEKLAQASLICGTSSGANCNKWNAALLSPSMSEYVSVPGISECIANIELAIDHKVFAGDHILVLGRVLKYGVDQSNRELPLLSIGKRTDGFKLLATKGIHRIAVIESGKLMHDEVGPM